MVTTSDYLKQLQADKQVLVDNLVAKGVTATSDETFTTLVPKVNDIQTGGGDISEYFDENPTAIRGSNNYIGGWHKLIKKIPKFDLAPTLLNYAFGGFKGTDIDLSGLDTSSVTNMSSMFMNCSNITNIDLSGLNTSSVTNMSSMFSGCTGLTNLNLSNWNVSLVTNMSSMFMNCSNLKTLDLSGWDTSQLTDMTNTFYECMNLDLLDIRNFDFTNVTKSGSNTFRVKVTCLIIVKDETAKEFVLGTGYTLTNVKTVAELEG